MTDRTPLPASPDNTPDRELDGNPCRRLGCRAHDCKSAARAERRDQRLQTLPSMNQLDGFDWPRCACPDPRRTSSFEFCENGAKAVTRRCRPNCTGRMAQPTDRRVTRARLLQGKGTALQPTTTEITSARPGKELFNDTVYSDLDRRRRQLAVRGRGIDLPKASEGTSSAATSASSASRFARREPVAPSNGTTRRPASSSSH